MFKHTVNLSLILNTLVILSFHHPALAQINSYKLTASVKGEYPHFGYSISISGDYIIVGAQYDEENGIESGSAYVFKRSDTNWAQEAKLLPFDAASGDHFGYSVSIFGDYAIVGSMDDEDNGIQSGSAYVFKREGTNWSMQQKLLQPKQSRLSQFGCSVSIYGDNIVIGAFLDENAYVFKREGTSWSMEQILHTYDGAVRQFFGSSVSIYGDYVIVGAPGDDENGSSVGSAYVFKREGTSWSQEAKIYEFDGTGYDSFGNSVSISGDFAVVGAPSDDENGNDAGSAYVFKRTGTSWAQEAKLFPLDAASDDDFGNSVSIFGDYAMVGAPSYRSGSAYVFKRIGTNWTQVINLFDMHGGDLSEAGASISISGDYFVVGVPKDDDKGYDAGSAYVFKRVGTSWSQEAKRVALEKEKAKKAKRVALEKEKAESEKKLAKAELERKKKEQENREQLLSAFQSLSQDEKILLNIKALGLGNYWEYMGYASSLGKGKSYKHEIVDVHVNQFGQLKYEVKTYSKPKSYGDWNHTPHSDHYLQLSSEGILEINKFSDRSAWILKNPNRAWNWESRMPASGGLPWTKYYSYDNRYFKDNDKSLIRVQVRQKPPGYRETIIIQVYKKGVGLIESYVENGRGGEVIVQLQKYKIDGIERTFSF